MRGVPISPLIWRDLKTFRKKILGLVGLQEYIVRLSKKQIAFLKDEATLQEIDLKFPVLFDGVKVFHGCRPDNVESYYSHGLLPLDAEMGKRIAMSIFLSGRFPELSEQDIENAAERANGGWRHEHLYVSLDDRFLIKRCGHYLIYGSEYICAIAAGLQCIKGNGYDYQQHLRRNGRPTVFVCQLPIDRINLSDRKALVAALVDEISSDPSFKRKRSSLCDFSFFLKSKLEPNHILEHRYPKTIPDPLRQMIPYRWAPEKSNSN